MNKVSFKLSIALTLLIFLIEGVLLVLSVDKKLISLRQMQSKEISLYGENKFFSDTYIEKRISSYKINIIILTVFISLFVVFGFISVYHLFVGRYLNIITKLNKEFSPEKTKLQFKQIPDDEIGELINSRIGMLTSLNQLISKNQQLIRILSHDLNNSLAVIMGNIHLLQSKWEVYPKEKVEKSLEKISLAAKNQAALLEKVITIEALKSKKIEVKLDQINFAGLYHELHSLFEEKLLQKEVTLTWKEDCDYFVWVDKVLFLNNVLANLLSNAIKFSKKGDTILIETSVKKDGTRVITLTDQGVGIPSELIENLFNPFIKTNRPGTSGEKGTGFGMPLVKETMNSFGGNIFVTSQGEELFPQNHGSVFTLELPAKIS